MHRLLFTARAVEGNGHDSNEVLDLEVGSFLYEASRRYVHSKAKAKEAVAARDAAQEEVLKCDNEIASLHARLRAALSKIMEKEKIRADGGNGERGSPPCAPQSDLL